MQLHEKSSHYERCSPPSCQLLFFCNREQTQKMNDQVKKELQTLFKTYKGENEDGLVKGINIPNVLTSILASKIDGENFWFEIDMLIDEFKVKAEKKAEKYIFKWQKKSDECSADQVVAKTKDILILLEKQRDAEVEKV